MMMIIVMMMMMIIVAMMRIIVVMMVMMTSTFPQSYKAGSGEIREQGDVIVVCVVHS